MDFGCQVLHFAFEQVQGFGVCADIWFARQAVNCIERFAELEILCFNEGLTLGCTM